MDLLLPFFSNSCHVSSTNFWRVFTYKSDFFVQNIPFRGFSQLWVTKQTYSRIAYRSPLFLRFLSCFCGPIFLALFLGSLESCKCLSGALGKLHMKIGPFTLAKTKIPTTWVFGCTVYTARKTHNIRGFWQEKRMREKTRISYLCFGKWCAWATSLYLWLYTCSAHYTSWAAVGWFRWRSRTTWPKTWIIPARLERAFTLAKNQWNFGGVSKNHAAEVGFSIRVFWSV